MRHYLIYKLKYFIFLIHKSDTNVKKKKGKLEKIKENSFLIIVCCFSFFFYLEIDIFIRLKYCLKVV